MSKKYISIIFLICATILIIFIVGTQNKCNYEDCNNKRISNSNYCSEHQNICQYEGCSNEKIPNTKWQDSKYCIEHNCVIDGCVDRKSDTSEYYCVYHEQKYNNLGLSYEQILKLDILISDYCKETVKKQDNVSSIKLVGENPKWSNNNLVYSCEIYRNGKIENGTITVSVNGDNFEIQGLTIK